MIGIISKLDSDRYINNNQNAFEFTPSVDCPESFESNETNESNYSSYNKKIHDYSKCINQKINNDCSKCNKQKIKCDCSKYDKQETRLMNITTIILIIAIVFAILYFNKKCPNLRNLSKLNLQ